MSALTTVLTEVVLPTGVVVGAIVGGVLHINKRRKQEIDRVNENIDALGQVVAVVISEPAQQPRRRVAASGDVVVPFPGSTPPADTHGLRLAARAPTPLQRLVPRLARLVRSFAPRVFTGGVVASAVLLLAAVYAVPSSLGDGVVPLPPNYHVIDPHDAVGHGSPAEPTQLVSITPTAPTTPPTAPDPAPAPATRAPAAPAPATRTPAAPAPAPTTQVPPPAPPPAPTTAPTTPPAPTTAPTTPPVPAPDKPLDDGKPGRTKPDSLAMHGQQIGNFVLQLSVLQLSVTLAPVELHLGLLDR